MELRTNNKHREQHNQQAQLPSTNVKQIQPPSKFNLLTNSTHGETNADSFKLPKNNEQRQQILNKDTYTEEDKQKSSSSNQMETEVSPFTMENLSMKENIAKNEEKSSKKNSRITHSKSGIHYTKMDVTQNSSPEIVVLDYSPKIKTPSYNTLVGKELHREHSSKTNTEQRDIINPKQRAPETLKRNTQNKNVNKYNEISYMENLIEEDIYKLFMHDENTRTSNRKSLSNEVITVQDVLGRNEMGPNHRTIIFEYINPEFSQSERESARCQMGDDHHLTTHIISTKTSNYNSTESSKTSSKDIATIQDLDKKQQAVTPGKIIKKISVTNLNVGNGEELNPEENPIRIMYSSINRTHPENDHREVKSKHLDKNPKTIRYVDDTITFVKNNHHSKTSGGNQPYENVINDKISVKKLIPASRDLTYTGKTLKTLKIAGHEILFPRIIHCLLLIIYHSL